MLLYVILFFVGISPLLRSSTQWGCYLHCSVPYYTQQASDAMDILAQALPLSLEGTRSTTGRFKWWFSWLDWDRPGVPPTGSGWKDLRACSCCVNWSTEVKTVNLSRYKNSTPRTLRAANVYRYYIYYILYIIYYILCTIYYILHIVYYIYIYILYYIYTHLVSQETLWSFLYRFFDWLETDNKQSWSL